MSDLDPADAALEAAAEEAGVSREELLKRALVALAESEGIDVPDAEAVSAVAARLDALDDEVDALDDDVASLDAELDEKVTDLRERFVDLYREVEALEGEAGDGEDDGTAARVDALAADVEGLADDLETLSGEVERLDDAASAERLGGLVDRVDDHDERLGELEGAVEGVDLDEVDDKLSRVASAVVRLKRRLDAAERDRADRERVDALTRTANRHGVRTADCDHCGGGVELGLLSTPECPHCGRRFEDLEPNTGFLGTSRLLVADRPAIDGDVERAGTSEWNPGSETGSAASDGGGDGENR